MEGTTNNSHSSHYTVFFKEFVNMVSNTQSERHQQSHNHEAFKICNGNMELKIGKSSSTAITMLQTLYYKM